MTTHNDPIIKTKQGQLQGHTRQSAFSGKSYFAFQGIPYAKPPVGELRFKDPEPFGSWEGVRDATKDGNSCKQYVMVSRPGMDPNKKIDGDEDCLFLNVYMNQLPEKSGCKKPVMFSIHGGGFSMGSGGSDSAGPDFLLEGDVVVVSINYRCGAFGFLSLESEEVSGNAGLKDQTLALRWVQQNIESFGGDQDNVTIFGVSAGGASVHYHMLSPLSRGLFHKAIIQSGFACNPWSLQPAPRASAVSLARELGCTSDSDQDILRTLQAAPADDIVTATKKISTSEHAVLGLVFVPSVEVAGAAPFLPDHPDTLMMKGEFHKVPVVAGVVQNEGSVAAFFGAANDSVFKELNERPEKLVPSFMELKRGSTEEKEVQKEIWDFYFKGNPISWNTIGSFYKYQSDQLFNIGMERTLRSLTKYSALPVFTYLMTNHSQCFCKLLAPALIEQDHVSKLLVPEACHGSDINYLYLIKKFGIPNLTPENKIAIQRHVMAWTTFARLGDPNYNETDEKWETFTEETPCHMELGETGWTMKEGIPFADRMNFWKKLIAKYCS